MGNDKTLSFVLSLSLICVSAEPSAQGSVELFIVPHLSWHQCIEKQAFSLVCKWGKLKNNSFQRWETFCRFGSLEKAYSSVKEDLVGKDLCAVLYVKLKVHGMFAAYGTHKLSKLMGYHYSSQIWSNCNIILYIKCACDLFFFNKSITA